MGLFHGRDSGPAPRLHLAEGLLGPAAFAQSVLGLNHLPGLAPPAHFLVMAEYGQWPCGWGLGRACEHVCVWRGGRGSKRGTRHLLISYYVSGRGHHSRRHSGLHANPVKLQAKWHCWGSPPESSDPSITPGRNHPMPSDPLRSLLSPGHHGPGVEH